ncbi:antitoxin VapB family protein [Candidatus Woesearchaeota archaeon]|nr:antitoxin VapB family protein [Candidatus Woesearchaeota archaeon]
MATKTITIMDDVYRLMSDEKRAGESFSDLLRRRFEKKSLMKFAGAWKSMTAGEAKELSESISLVRGEMDKRFRGGRK